MVSLKRTVSFFLFTFYFLVPSLAQDSSRLRISLLTCTPGEELYSTFGHSAYRIVDSSKAFNDWQDVVYNYGTFNFDDEGFYLKFVQGKLLYYVSATSFADFKYDYETTNRGITEQVLLLTSDQKIAIQRFLNENLKEENKYYLYDFFFDNCTTRLRDILKKHKDSSFTLTPVMPLGSTFRNAIHQYLDRNHKYWSKLGIDILMGVPTDGVMTAAQMQFLPDNLMKSLDSSKVPMVVTAQNLYPITDKNSRPSLFTPLLVFSVLFLVIFLLGFVQHPFAKAFLHGFDGLFFFVTGVLGIIIMFMWWGTEHSMTKDNFNLLWAWPTHAVMAFFVNSPQGAVHRKKWVSNYFKLTAIALTGVLVSWFFLPQQMNNGLLPIILLLIYRSLKRAFASQYTNLPDGRQFTKLKLN